MEENKKETVEIDIIEPKEDDDFSRNSAYTFNGGGGRVEYTNIKSTKNPFLILFGTIIFPILLLLMTIFVVPALAIWIWAKIGFIKAALFVIVYIGSAVLWNMVMGTVISLSQRLRSNLHLLVRISITLLIFSILVNVAMPWIVAGFFLGWIRI